MPIRIAAGRREVAFRSTSTFIKLKTLKAWFCLRKRASFCGSDPFHSAHAAIPVVVVSACLSR